MNIYIYIIGIWMCYKKCSCGRRQRRNKQVKKGTEIEMTGISTSDNHQMADNGCEVVSNNI